MIDLNEEHLETKSEVHRLGEYKDSKERVSCFMRCKNEYRKYHQRKY